MQIRLRPTFVRVLGALAIVAATGCGDGLGPREWNATPDTTLLYSLSRQDLFGQPAGFDFVQLIRVIVEGSGATGTWDAVLAEEGGAFVMVPASFFPGLSSRAAIGLTSARSLEELRQAPGDTASYSRRPVPLREGSIYVVRTRTAACSGFGAGVYYAKFEVVSTDPALGAVRLAVVRNPFCNDRALVPEN